MLRRTPRAQRLQVAKPLAPRQQLALLGLVRCGVVDLAKLELEQVELTLTRPRDVLEPVKLRARLTGTGMGGGTPRAQR